MSAAVFSEVTRLAADLARAETHVDRRAAEVIYATSNAIRDTAKQLAPVDTGTLRESITAGMHTPTASAPPSAPPPKHPVRSSPPPLTNTPASFPTR